MSAEIGEGVAQELWKYLCRIPDWLISGPHLECPGAPWPRGWGLPSSCGRGRSTSMPGRCHRQCRQGPATRRTAGLAKLSAFCCCCFLYGDQTERVFVSAVTRRLTLWLSLCREQTRGRQVVTCYVLHARWYSDSTGPSSNIILQLWQLWHVSKRQRGDIFTSPVFYFLFFFFLFFQGPIIFI